MAVERRLLGLVLAVALLAGCGGADEPPMPRKVPLLDGSIVDVGGHYLYFYCSGRGAPTVILEAGFGGSTRAWSEVQPPIATFTRVCSYDRAGLGASEPGPKARTSKTIADELDELLENARIDGPYVLVGHSFGGMHLRVFADEHGDDVAGVVFVDSSHPDATARLRAALPPERPGEDESLAQLRRELRPGPIPNPEGLDVPKSEQEVRRTGSLGDIPVVVLTAGRADAPAGFPASVERRLQRVWLAAQRDLASLSSDSLHVVALDSGHLIQSNLGQPQLVVRAVRQGVRAVRSDSAMTPCASAFAGFRARCVA